MPDRIAQGRPADSFAVARMKPAGAVRVHLSSLTPLRGIAAVWVVLYHYNFQYFPNIHPEKYAPHLIGSGYLAVDFFFLLSGFVISHVYGQKFARSVKLGSYLDFVKARIARLYPLHLFMLALFLATAFASRAAEFAVTGSFEAIPLQGARSVEALIANLFMLQGLKAGDLSWNYPAWSISIEFIAYLLVPFLLPALWLGGKRLVSTIFTADVVLFIALAYTTKGNLNQWNGPETLLRCLPEFILGCLLYRVYACRILSRLLTGDIAFLAAMLAVLSLLQLGLPDILLVPAFAALLLAAVNNDGSFTKVLNTPVLIYLGEISYSLYLAHGFVQYLTTAVLKEVAGVTDRAMLSDGTSLLCMLGMVAVSFVLAAFTYRFVELTGRRRLRVLFRIGRPLAPAN